MLTSAHDYFPQGQKFPHNLQPKTWMHACCTTCSCAPETSHMTTPAVPTQSTKNRHQIDRTSWTPFIEHTFCKLCCETTLPPSRTAWGPSQVPVHLNYPQCQCHNGLPIPPGKQTCTLITTNSLTPLNLHPQPIQGPLVDTEFSGSQQNIQNIR